MSIAEVILCVACFGAVSFLMYRYMVRKNPKFQIRGQVIVPGLIAANIVSLLVSRPGDRLFQPRLDWTDQSIFIGFPASFYEIGAFGDNRIHIMGYVIDMIVMVSLRAFFAGYIAKRRKEASNSKG